METHVLVVHTRPRPGAEAEYHRWYDDFHLDEVLRVPGFVSARRLQLLPGDAGGDRAPGLPAGPGSHLALFTVETDDIDATIAAFERARITMRTPDCLDPDSVTLSWWRSLSHRTTTPPPTGPGHPDPAPGPTPSHRKAPSP
ncbi:hypothetical protein OG350_02670 [Streptomyces achromogenes]|uniref:EthD domain-containing protein n=1 Tax=Streptomyces achromogenes TaxID=67255 RepID=A0ABZ1KJ79_STRAH